MTATPLDTALDSIAAINLQNIRYEIETLREIKTWAMQQLRLDFEPGDRVVITSDRPSEIGGGWAPFNEALAPGQTGIAGEITYSKRTGTWQVLVGMDHAWAAHPNGLLKTTRYWYGPADETPDGDERPSTHDQEHHPEGRVQHFSLNVGWVAKAPAEVTA